MVQKPHHSVLTLIMSLWCSKSWLQFLLIGLDSVHFLFDFLQNFLFTLSLYFNLLATETFDQFSSSVENNIWIMNADICRKIGSFECLLKIPWCQNRACFTLIDDMTEIVALENTKLGNQKHKAYKVPCQALIFVRYITSICLKNNQNYKNIGNIKAASQTYARYWIRFEVDLTAWNTKCFDKEAKAAPIFMQPFDKNANRQMKQRFHGDHKHIVSD